LRRTHKIAVLTVAGAGVLTVALAGMEPRATMHELDWWTGEGEPAVRYYRSADHLLHHLGELLTLTAPAFRVYVMRALEPEFREQIMLVTAMANDCSG